jgi:hypothetical protein
MSSYPADVLDALRGARQVRIVTGGGRHTTIIWIVVDPQDRVLVRSVRGPRGRWYREALREGQAGLQIGKATLQTRVELADDPDRVEATSEALRQKYRTSGASLASMLREETLPTTLELHPA